MFIAALEDGMRGTATQPEQFGLLPYTQATVCK